MSNILIIGGGNSGSRYCNSLLLFSDHRIFLCSQRVNGKTYELAKKYGLNFFLFNELRNRINEFDVIILSIPIKEKKIVLEKILIDWKYRNKLILEKPMALSENECMCLEKMLQINGNSYIIGYQKRYFWNIEIEKNNDLEIYYPSIKGKRYIIHNLAHALDLCMKILNIKTLVIEECIKYEQSCFFICRYDKGNVKILIDQTEDIKKEIAINGKSVPWPSLEVYSNMVQMLLDSKIENYICRDIEIARILSEYSDLYEWDSDVEK